MTTGMTDFMISSGLITDIAAIPVPDLAVPYAAPRAEKCQQVKLNVQIYFQYVFLYAGHQFLRF